MPNADIYSQVDTEEFVKRNKARFTRRLGERWKCSDPGHSLCYKSVDGLHVPLGNDAIELWVFALVRILPLNKISTRH